MKKRFYSDTSIWLDFFEKRGEHGSSALKLINKIIEHEDIITYSIFVIKELKNLGYSDGELKEIFGLQN